MKKSRRIASFWMLSSAKIEEVSLNCCGFGCCQVQKLRKSRSIAAFLMLSSSKTVEVLQNSFVFKLVDRQIDRKTSTSANYNYKYHYTTLLQLQVQIYYATLHNTNSTTLY